MGLDKLRKDLQKLANPKKAKLLQRFFKTGKGEYGEGDVFLGVMVPQQRILAKKYKTLPFREIQTLLQSKIHEQRLIGLFILTYQYQKVDPSQKKKIVDFYLSNTKNINNWDLIDLSAPKILGDHLLDKPRDILYRLARSKMLWERRMAILATSAFIRQNQFEDTLKLAELLLQDKHDLIHKGVGWMLREVGKKDLKAEESFLREFYKAMPRTMLRYAIEKFPEEKRMSYLK